MPGIAGYLRLMVITETHGGRSHLDVARAALQAGCRALQFRDKEMGDREFLALAGLLLEECKKADALLIVNDRVDIAVAINANGVHLGIEDMDVLTARWMTGPGSFIGYSPSTMEDARVAVDEGADYLGVGPVFESPTKADAGAPIGTGLLEDYCRAFEVPVIGVGGIKAANAKEVIRAGASGVAVVSAVSRAADMLAAARAIAEAVGE